MEKDACHSYVIARECWCVIVLFCSAFHVTPAAMTYCSLIAEV